MNSRRGWYKTSAGFLGNTSLLNEWFEGVKTWGTPNLIHHLSKATKRVLCKCLIVIEDVQL